MRIFLPNAHYIYYVKIYISILERNCFLNLAEYIDELFRLTRFLRIGEHSPSWLSLSASKRSGGDVLKDYYTLEQKRLIESVLASPVG